MIDFKGNKGEWSEVYIFLKLLNDGKIAIADKSMNAIKNVFLNIIKIFRENYTYATGKIAHIVLNDEEIGSVGLEKLKECQSKIFDMIQKKVAGESIVAPNDVATFLESIKVTKLKAPAEKSNDFFGGTQDLTMEVEDFRTGITGIYGFSCKSSFSAEATLFNASKDNTNFRYEITGKIDDAIMNKFNSMFDSKGHAAIIERLKFLKDKSLNLKFKEMVVKTAERNLVLSGGIELPIIIADMLYFYYYVNGAHSEGSDLNSALDYVTRKNSAKYKYEKELLRDIYKRKIATLLYDMFTGMRFASPWNGRSSVNGGYIIAKKSGEVIAYHSMIADEFKDFLIQQLGFERASCSRHNYMKIEKNDGKYFLKLSLQIRFKKITGNL